MTNAAVASAPASPAAAPRAGTPAPGAIPAAAGGVHSLASERDVLAASLRPERAHLLVGLMGKLASADFFLDAHGNIWSCVRALTELGRPANVPAVIDYAASKGLHIGGADYVVALLDDPTTLYSDDEGVQGSASRVKEYSTLRLLQSTLLRAQQMASAASEPVNAIMARLQDDLINLSTLSETSRRGPRKLVEVLDTVLEHVEKAQDGTAALALPTGFHALDRMIDGFYDEDLIILAARPSMGKTSALLNTAKRRAKLHNRPQLIFSTESRDMSLAIRTLSSESSVPASDIRNGRLDGEALERMSEGLHRLADLPIWIDDTPGMTLSDIRARARQFVTEHGTCDIWVDYLQNITAGPDSKGRSSERNEQVGEISKGLKNLARELKVPVIALAQLSRSLESRSNKRPMMSDLRESGQIEQDADVIIFLYRDDYYNPDSKTPGVAEWIVSKQREGSVGIVEIGWNAKTTTFYDLSAGGDDY